MVLPHGLAFFLVQNKSFIAPLLKLILQPLIVGIKVDIKMSFGVTPQDTAAWVPAA
jgi:hypothetical protein